MSLCTRNRWGPGTKSNTNTTNSANKEMEEKLKKMREEREKQDSMWTTTSSSRETGK